MVIFLKFAGREYKNLADNCPYPVYIYDLPSVTQFRMNMEVIDAVINHPNIKGMKSLNWELIKKIERKYKDADFECFYSGLDNFDYANQIGIKKNRDGMFACTPKNGKALYESINANDYVGARKYLDNILLLRDTMAEYGLMRCFTICMNMLGLEGNYHEDYSAPEKAGAKEKMAEVLKLIGEI